MEKTKKTLHLVLKSQWYDNGQMMTRKNFKDNKLDGLYEEYDENGKLIKRLTFKDSEIVNNC